MNHFGVMPLHLAAAVGNKHMVELLLANGADVNVNSPPPNRRWLRVTAEAGLIGRAADYTTLKSSSGSGGLCSSIYRFQTSSVTLPLVATQ